MHEILIVFAKFIFGTDNFLNSHQNLLQFVLNVLNKKVVYN